MVKWSLVLEQSESEQEEILTPLTKTTSQNVWPRINSLIKTARSTVSKNRAERGFFFTAPAAIFRKRDISGASERAFWVSFGRYFWLLNSLQKEVF